MFSSFHPISFFILFAVVLCPLSVTDGWVSETASFAPKLRLLSYVGDKDHRRSLRKNIYDHVNTEGDVSPISDIFWWKKKYMVIDCQILTKI